MAVPGRGNRRSDHGQESRTSSTNSAVGFQYVWAGTRVPRDDVTYSVFCFADASHTERFCETFRGERFDPEDRGRGSAWFLWRKS